MFTTASRPPEAKIRESKQPPSDLKETADRIAGNSEATANEVVSNSIGMALRKLEKRYEKRRTANETGTGKEESDEEYRKRLEEEYKELINVFKEKVKPSHDLPPSIKAGIELLLRNVEEKLNDYDHTILCLSEEHVNPEELKEIKKCISQKVFRYTEISSGFYEVPHTFPLKKILSLVWKALHDDDRFKKDPKKLVYTEDDKKKDREDRFLSFYRSLVEMTKDPRRRCHQGVRHELVFILNGIHEDVDIITDALGTVHKHLQDGAIQRFWDCYEHKDTSPEKKAALRQALYDWLNDFNIGGLLNITDPENHIVRNLNALFKAHGSNPEKETTKNQSPKKMIDGARVYLNFESDLPPEKDGPYRPPLRNVKYILDLPEIDEKQPDAKAVLKMKEWTETWITKEPLLENKDHVTRAEYFNELREMYHKLKPYAEKEYECLLVATGHKDQFDTLRAQCIKYFESVCDEKDFPPSPELTQTFNQAKSAKSLVEKFDRKKKEYSSDWLKHFWATWFLAERPEDKKSLYHTLRDPIVQKMVLFESDESIKHHLKQSTKKVEEEAILTLDLPTINHFFLQAYLVPLEKQSEYFKNRLSTILNFVKRAGEEKDTITPENFEKKYGCTPKKLENLKKTSYPPTLLDNLENLYRTPQLVDRLIVLPEDIRTPGEWNQLKNYFSPAQLNEMYQKNPGIEQAFVRNIENLFIKDGKTDLSYSPRQFTTFIQTLEIIPAEKQISFCKTLGEKILCVILYDEHSYTACKLYLITLSEKNKVLALLWWAPDETLRYFINSLEELKEIASPSISKDDLTCLLKKLGQSHLKKIIPPEKLIPFLQSNNLSFEKKMILLDELGSPYFERHSRLLFGFLRDSDKELFLPLFERIKKWGLFTRVFSDANEFGKMLDSLPRSLACDFLAAFTLHQLQDFFIEINFNNKARRNFLNSFTSDNACLKNDMALFKLQLLFEKCPEKDIKALIPDMRLLLEMVNNIKYFSEPSSDLGRECLQSLFSKLGKAHLHHLIPDIETLTDLLENLPVSSATHEKKREQKETHRLTVSLVIPASKPNIIQLDFLQCLGSEHLQKIIPDENAFIKFLNSLLKPPLCLNPIFILIELDELHLHRIIKDATILARMTDHFYHHMEGFLTILGTHFQTIFPDVNALIAFLKKIDLREPIDTIIKKFGSHLRAIINNTESFMAIFNDTVLTHANGSTAKTLLDTLESKHVESCIPSTGTLSVILNGLQPTHQGLLMDWLPERYWREKISDSMALIVILVSIDRDQIEKLLSVLGDTHLQKIIPTSKSLEKILSSMKKSNQSILFDHLERDHLIALTRDLNMLTAVLSRAKSLSSAIQFVETLDPDLLKRFFFGEDKKPSCKKIAANIREVCKKNQYDVSTERALLFALTRAYANLRANIPDNYYTAGFGHLFGHNANEKRRALTTLQSYMNKNIQPNKDSMENDAMKQGNTGAIRKAYKATFEFKR